MDFEYSDPTPDFDRSKVKGIVASLVSLPKEHLNKSTALEVCAGGKLYQVVVETQEVATQLLQKGKLRRRVTIIPLNKINAFKVQAEVNYRVESLIDTSFFVNDVENRYCKKTFSWISRSGSFSCGL